VKFQVGVKRTNHRKTASIKIQQGVEQVIVPKSLLQKGIDDLIQKKTDWILRKLAL